MVPDTFTRVSFLSGEPAPVATQYDETNLRTALSETTDLPDDDVEDLIRRLLDGEAVNINETVTGLDHARTGDVGAETIDIIYPGSLTIYKMGVG